MALTIVKSRCGCLSLLDFKGPPNSVLVNDAELMPASDIGIYGIVLGDNAYVIDRVFTNKNALLSFLNTTFVEAYGLFGYFDYDGLDLYYTNPENFDNAELLMIYKNEKRCYVVGAPDTECNPAYVDAVIDTGIAPDVDVQLSDVRAFITDVEVLEMFVESEKVTEDNSNINGYGQLKRNVNIYVITQQVPASSAGFPFIFNFTLT